MVKEIFRVLQMAAITTVVCAGAMSCADGNKGDAKLQQQIDSLRQADEQHKTELNNMTNFIDALSVGFDTLQILENQLFDSGIEGKGNTRQQLQEKLQLFSETLQGQRSRIAELTKELEASGANVSKLQGLVDMLNSQLDQKDRMISDLRKELQNKNVDIAKLRSHVGELTKANKEFAEYVENQIAKDNARTEADNAVYVVVGSAKVLKEAGITSGGGLLSKKKVSADANTDYFTKKDMRNFTQLEIPSAKASIVSNMPKNSYKIEKVGKDQSVLTITDPATFWSQTRYLVVQTK